jgi:hypothetical protein
MIGRRVPGRWARWRLLLPHRVKLRQPCCEYLEGPVHGRFCLRFIKTVHVVGFGVSVFLWLPAVRVTRW